MATYPTRVPDWFHKGTVAAGTLGMVAGALLADGVLSGVMLGVAGWMAGCVVFIVCALVALRIGRPRR